MNHIGSKILSCVAVVLLTAVAIPGVTAGSGGGSVNNKAAVVATFATTTGLLNFNNPTQVEFSGTITDQNKACDLQTLKIDITGAESVSNTVDLTAGSGACNVGSEPGSFTAGFKVWKSASNTISFRYQRTFAVTGTLTVTPSAKDEASYVAGTPVVVTIQDKITLFANPVDLSNVDLGASAKWGSWTADPGATVASTNFVRVTNSGTTATQQFTLAFSGDFAAAGDAIPLASNVKFDCREGTSSDTPTALGMDTPSWSTTTSGTTTQSFTATGKVIFCAYQIVALPDPLTDAAYSAAYTATAA